MKKRLLSLFLAACMVLGMLPVHAFALTDVPFEVYVNDTALTGITEGTLSWTSWDGSTSDVVSYTVPVPENAVEATLIFEEEKQWSYYDSQGNYVGDGDTSWTSLTEHTVAIQDSNNDGELDGISVQRPNAYSTEFYIQFVYASGEEESDAPFLNIRIGDADVESENIIYKGIFELGDYAEDEQQEQGDTYDYVHQVPYYHVIVPCGTASVDVTYSAETNIMYSGTSAYGYKTDLEVDAVTSATVRGATFKNAYTKNDDGTQTVKTPVTGYTFDADGNGHAITLEENDSPFAAICLFTFEYDGVNHVYTDVVTAPTCTEQGYTTHTCSCGDTKVDTYVDAAGHSYVEGVCTACGEADPDYVAPGGAVIPEGAPFTALTTDAGDAAAFEDMGKVDYTGYNTYSDVPYYHVTIPAGATQVYVTHPASEDPFADASYSSAYGYYAETEGWTGGGVTFTFEEAEDGFVIALPLSRSSKDWNTGETVEMSFVADEDGYVAYAVAVERNDYSPICFFTFEFAEADPGEHIHDYGEGVVTTEPGCETVGEKTYTCSCGDSYTEEIPATGHSYDEGVVTTEPTCTEAGVKTFTCSGCGETKTESVPAMGHDYQNGACANCGDVCPMQDENGVFQIGTYEELLWFANAVNGGNTAIKGVLTADITVAADWPGIGNSSNRFAGSFDGKNHTVTLSGGVWGLFGYTMGTHKDHNLKDAAIIQNVILEGTVQNSALIQDAGYTHISGCINRADVTGGNSYVAGIVGSVSGSNKYGQTYSDVLIRNCGNEGNIRGDSKVGGILGYTQANTRLDGCYNTGAISGNSEVGGLVGYMQGSSKASSVKNSYNKGTVTGDTFTGGILGQQYNGVSVANVYNAGASAYAISGRVYNKTASASNIYYRSDLSTYGEPEYFQGSTGAANGFNTTVRGVAKCSGDMGSAEFAELLGDAFQESCGGPVLTWQEAKAHNLIDGICYECKAGHTEKAKYNVNKSTGAGYEIVGDTIVNEGNNYTFQVVIQDGYYATESFAVYANGIALTAVEGIYTVENITGHFYVTVQGVKEQEGVLAVSLPGAGGGYRVNPCEGYGTTVVRGDDYKFTVTFAEGFQAGPDFAVKVNGEVILPDENGVYTVEHVTAKLDITVEGVDIIVSGNTVTVMVDITRGEKEFLYAEASDDLMLDKELEIAYFDLALYGLEKYYYNPYCYVDANGKINSQQQSGNRETAYDVVTSMHAFIYMTEIYYLGMDAEDAGTGLSDRIDSDNDGISDFDESVSWTQGVGSSFMNLWGLGSNLNYHLNYVYPTAYDKWGSTSDQQALKDGDVLSVHLITGSASGSAFGLFAVNDENNTYDRIEEKDTATVHQGEQIKLTLYWGTQGPNYTTAFVTGVNKPLYWVEQGDQEADVTRWNKGNFGSMTAEAMVTDANGEITIDTTDLEPGTYYLAVAGEFVAGNGQAGSDGFVSRGSEAGPAYFKLTVLEAEEPQPEVVASGWSGYTTWVLTDDGVLTFSPSDEQENGQTNMRNYWKVNGVLTLPWSDYADKITKVVIQEGIHDIGQMAFYELPNLTEVVLPESTVEIREYTFKNCKALTTINLEVVEFIREGAFYGCSALENVKFAEDVVIEDWAFSRTGVILP